MHPNTVLAEPPVLPTLRADCFVAKPLALLLLAMPMLAAQAQSGKEEAAAGASGSAQLSGITVTAKGYASERAETPVSTTVLDATSLARKAASNPGAALRGEPGLAVNSDSAQGQNPVIRGLKRDAIVLMVDGMRFNSAQPAGAIASFMSMGLAERLEVVKGPASVLYGTGALGGAINVQLPQARFDQGMQILASAQASSADRGLGANAVLNRSWGDHAVMLGGSLSHADDYRSPEGRVEHSGYDSRALIGQYRFRLDPVQQLRLSLQQHEDKDVWYPGSTRPHPSPRIGSLIVHSPSQHRRLYELGYSYQKNDLLPVNVDLRLYRQQMKRSIYAHARGLGRDIARTDVTFSTDGFDARADWQASPRHLLSLGSNLWRMKANPDSRMAGPPAFAAFAPSNPFRDGQIKAMGVYVQDDMVFGALNVLAGLRYDRVEGSAAAMNNGRVTSGLDRADGAVSASLGAVYRIDAALRPFINVSRAFRAPDLRERYQSGPRSDGFFYAGSPKLAPETATQIELGLKGASGTLDYTVSVYRNRISDYITGSRLQGDAAIAACGRPNAAACKQAVNLGHVTLTGMEADVRWRFAPGQSAHLGYGMVRGQNDDLDEPLYQMPADALRLGWEGRVAPQWRLDADWYLVRRQDRVATKFTRGTENATAGYGLVDIGATWLFRPGHSLRLALRNAGNKRYHEHLAEGFSGQELLAPGRSLQLVWQGHF